MTTDKSGRTSAGILLWRSREGRLEVLLAHQGGPFWVKKDLGHWTIPKGELEPGEELVAVARREFAEETGCDAPNQPLIELGQITQKSGKLVLGWAVEGDLDPSTADKLVENVLGIYGIPFGIALNVRVNGRDRIVPLVIDQRVRP